MGPEFLVLRVAYSPLPTPHLKCQILVGLFQLVGAVLSLVTGPFSGWPSAKGFFLFLSFLVKKQNGDLARVLFVILHTRSSLI